MLVSLVRAPNLQLAPGQSDRKRPDIDRLHQSRIRRIRTNSQKGTSVREPAHEATDTIERVAAAMKDNSTGGFRRLSGALACTVIIAGLAASQAAAQPVPLAFRADYAYLCFEDQLMVDFIEYDSYLVTPAITMQFADEPTWLPDGTRIAFVDRGTVVGRRP